MIRSKAKQDRAERHVGRWNTAVLEAAKLASIHGVCEMPTNVSLACKSGIVELSMKSWMLIVLCRICVVVADASEEKRRSIAGPEVTDSKLRGDNVGGRLQTDGFLRFEQHVDSIFRARRASPSPSS